MIRFAMRFMYKSRRNVNVGSDSGWYKDVAVEIVPNLSAEF